MPCLRTLRCEYWGFVQGDGTRQGSGECECDVGYEGGTCDECGDDHFEEKDENSKLKCTGEPAACLLADPAVL